MHDALPCATYQTMQTAQNQVVSDKFQDVFWVLLADNFQCRLLFPDGLDSQNKFHFRVPHHHNLLKNLIKIYVFYF